jgi:hypothetical protein
MDIEHPFRVAHSYTQNLRGPAELVFPLLCPVREADWIEGWSPSLVITASGAAERDCVFITGTGAETAIWVITEHDPERGRIEFVRTTPGTAVTRIMIDVRAVNGDRCTADVCYQHTALSAAGEQAMSTLTAEHFRGFMRIWEDRLNHYLETGEMLRGVDA